MPIERGDGFIRSVGRERRARMSTSSERLALSSVGTEPVRCSIAAMNAARSGHPAGAAYVR